MEDTEETQHKKHKTSLEIVTSDRLSETEESECSWAALKWLQAMAGCDMSHSFKSAIGWCYPAEIGAVP